MVWYHYLLIGLGAALLVLIAIILIRALTFKDNTNYQRKVEKVSCSSDVVDCLSKMLKVDTTSHPNKKDINYDNYQKYINLVKSLYPLVFEKCEFEQTKDYAIKLKLKGISDKNPTVLMAHYDVVPVTEGWDYDPFLGEVVDGFLYGRGAIDTKCTMACALSALENALKENYVPKNDLYLCFGANEEVYGDSQLNIVYEMKKQGIKPALVFDEGGGIMNKAFPGVKEDTAFLGVVEKGMINVKLSLDSNGGHSSTPKKNGPVIRLSKALLKLEKNPMKPQYTKAVKELLSIMGKHSSFVLKIFFANMWIFSGLVKWLFSKVSPDTRALLTTTFAFTVLNGGNQTNIIPNHVEANINVRIAPFNTIEEVINHIKKVINDDDIVITYSDANKMYPECDFNQKGYEIIKDTTIETYPNTVVAPFIMLGGTDARHYNEICDCVIRFSPLKLTNADRAGIHGLNEKIKLETLQKCLEFYQRLLTKI